MLPSPPCPHRSHFSLEVKLNSSSGLLFYVAGEQGTFMALFVSNGRFVFLVDVGGRRLRIRSKDKYRDRRWHTVSRGLGLSGTSLNYIAPRHRQVPMQGFAPCSPALGITSELHMGHQQGVQRGQQNHSQGWLNLRAESPFPGHSPGAPPNPGNPQPWH